MNLSRKPRQCPPPKPNSVHRPEDWPPSARASARAPAVFNRPAPPTGRLPNSPRAANQFSARPDGSNRAGAGWNALTWDAASHGRRPSHAVTPGRRDAEPRGDPLVRLSVVLENLLPRRLTEPAESLLRQRKSPPLQKDKGTLPQGLHGGAGRFGSGRGTGTGVHPNARRGGEQVDPSRLRPVFATAILQVLCRPAGTRCGKHGPG